MHIRGSMGTCMSTRVRRMLDLQNNVNVPMYLNRSQQLTPQQCQSGRILAGLFCGQSSCKSVLGQKCLSAATAWDPSWSHPSIAELANQTTACQLSGELTFELAFLGFWYLWATAWTADAMLYSYCTKCEFDMEMPWWGFCLHHEHDWPAVMMCHAAA